MNSFAATEDLVRGSLFRFVRSTGMTRLICFSAIVVSILVSPGITSAQSLQTGDGRSQVDLAGLDIQAVAGWGGAVDTSMPVPLSFLISNFSANTVEGVLTLSDPLTDKSVVLGEVFVGPNGVKRFSSVQALPNWFQCVATFQNDDGILWRRELAFMSGMDLSEDVNYLLFIDDGGRMLQWPVDQSSEGNSENSANAGTQYSPAAGHGRPVQPLAVKSWQVPQHEGPLTAVQAIVFSEAAAADMLNDVQWNAIAKWMCLGGTIFVSEESEDVVDRLKSSAPLTVQPAANVDNLNVHRCGSGAIGIYTGPLFSTTDKTAVQSIADAASKLSRYNMFTTVDELDLGWWRSENSNKTRMLVVTVFSVYTLLSGLVTLLLFRQTRRRIAIYTSVIVALGCVAAIALGGMLRTSKGDIRWVSITAAGPGGLVQLAKVDMQSAGGRNTLLTMTGPDLDLQRVDADSIGYRPYYRYRQKSNRTGYPAFTEQSNLLESEADGVQIKIPITPWGYRQAYATSFSTSSQRLDVRLSYEPPERAVALDVGAFSTSTASFGTFTITLKNQLSLDLTRCQLVVSSSRINLDPGKDIPTYDPRTGGFQLKSADVIGDIITTQSSVTLSDLVQSAEVTQQIRGMSDDGQDRWNASGRWHEASRSLPDAPYRGGTAAWVIGVLSKSPALGIDQQRSDFDPGENEAHLFIQQIPPEDLPAEWIEFHRIRMEHQLAIAAQLKSP